MNPNEASANKYYNITTNGDTLIEGRIVLIRIVVNTKGGSSNTATLFDGTDSSDKVGTIDTTITERVIEYGIPLLNGLKITTATGSAPNLTVIYAETP
jgi:hypothetical protein